MVQCEFEIMRLGSLINCSCEAAQTSHELNVKGPGSKVNHGHSALGTLMAHAPRLVGSSILGT